MYHYRRAVVCGVVPWRGVGLDQGRVCWREQQRQDRRRCSRRLALRCASRDCVKRRAVRRPGLDVRREVVVVVRRKVCCAASRRAAAEISIRDPICARTLAPASCLRNLEPTPTKAAHLAQRSIASCLTVPGLRDGCKMIVCRCASSTWPACPRPAVAPHSSVACGTRLACTHMPVPVRRAPCLPTTTLAQHVVCALQLRRAARDARRAAARGGHAAGLRLVRCAGVVKQPRQLTQARSGVSSTRTASRTSSAVSGRRISPRTCELTSWPLQRSTT